MPLEQRRQDRALDRLVSQALRRTWVQHAAMAAAAGAVTGAAAGALSNPLLGFAAASVAAVAVLASTAKRRTRMTIVRSIEAARPGARNVVVTADELERHPERAAHWITSRILAEADSVALGVRALELVPLRATIIFAGLAMLAVVATALLSGGRASRLVEPLSSAVAKLGFATEQPTFTAMVTPPAYTGLPVQRMKDPARIEVLEGSRIALEVSPPGASIRFGDKPLEADFVAREGGYFALADARGELARLIVLVVQHDRVPLVRIESPARDLLLPDAGRPIPITIVATDDLALQNLELRFTTVSGSGEQFDFTEGTAPLRLERRSGREWRGDGTFDLAAMKLGPGDSFVYRAVSRDRRPGNEGIGTSDTYFVEIAGPGRIALEGVDMPPELDRYAMSQQMIVLKLERLQARQASMSREALVEESLGLAAEQRTVRANFVFLLGGHVEDEEEEAEQSHEIQEGRLENTARKDVNRAIGHMTRAEQGMTAAEPAAALPPARAAVDALQRAFGRSRYLLRSLAVKSRIDPARRLTGDTSGARGWRRSALAADPGNRHEVVAVFEGILGVASAVILGRSTAAGDLERLAERALAIDPGNELWQETAGVLLSISRLRAAASGKEVATLEAVLSKIAAEVRRGSLARSSAPDVSPVGRAFQAEQRR